MKALTTAHILCFGHGSGTFALTLKTASPLANATGVNTDIDIPDEIVSKIFEALIFALVIINILIINRNNNQ